MNTGIKRTCKDYTLSFKLAVVEQVERGDLTYLEAQDRYGIQGSSTVLTWLRRLVGISRQAYYQRTMAETAKTQQYQTVVQLIKEQRMAQPRIGTRKLHHMLQEQLAEHHIKIGRDALFEVLRQARMLIHPKRCYHKTTHSHHRFYKHPNLLKPGQRQVIPNRPEQVCG
jgi:transposase-like protein